MRVLEEAAWREREREHRARLAPWTGPHLERRARGERHPVYDFLFEYYSLPAGKLLRWSPGAGCVLRGGAEGFLAAPGFRAHAEGVALDPADFPAPRREALEWVRSFLRATAARPPQFGCFGLHEWAMVYRSAEVRHGAVPLRMTPEALAAFVEGQAVCCTHYDAFRFFTPEARSLNRMQPEKGRQPELDQAGCIHVNMDLYKWAFKFAPWISGELTADCFLLAAAAREVDMRASPYDLAAHGFPAIPIETSEGREAYAAHQRELAERGRPLRHRLLEELEALG